MTSVLRSAFYDLIRLYFPPGEHERANSVALTECPTGDPLQVRDEGWVDCGQGQREAKSYGVFRLLDVCFDPALSPESPFTVEQWARRLDPNVNVWMASVVFSRYGWRAWTSCGEAEACEYAGLPIPYPRGPEADLPGAGGLVWLGALALGGYGLYRLARRG